MRITYLTINNKLHVKVPYDCKDSFKLAVDKSKREWDPVGKVWVVDASSKSVVDAFIESCGREQKIIYEKTKEERELALKAAEELRVHRAMLAEKARAQKAKKNQAALIKIGGIINIDLILSCIDTMSSAVKIRRAEARKKFVHAQSLVEKEYTNLRQNGWYSEGLYNLAMMSYNRPDRDFPSSVTIDEILDISECEKLEISE